MTQQVWLIGRMHKGERQIRNNPDGTVAAYESREKAEEAIANDNLGSDCFAFPVDSKDSVYLH